MNSQMCRWFCVFAAAMAVPGALWSETAKKFAVPKAPHISAIFSPKRTVMLQSGDFQRLLRYPEVLPTSPFAMVSQENDIVEFTFPDGSILRQGPNTKTECDPATHEITIVVGSILTRFSSKTTLQLKNLDIKGKDCLAMVNVATEGVKVFSLAGQVDFHGKRIKEGEMYLYNGQPKLEGPFLIDLKVLIRSSPIAIEFPKSPWIELCMEKPFQNQQRMKDFGLVEPANTMLEGGGTQVQSALPAPPSPVETHSKSREDSE